MRGATCLAGGAPPPAPGTNGLPASPLEIRGNPPFCRHKPDTAISIRTFSIDVPMDRRTRTSVPPGAHPRAPDHRALGIAGTAELWGSWGRRDRGVDGIVGSTGSWGRRDRGVVGSWDRGIVGSWGRGIVGSWGRRDRGVDGTAELWGSWGRRDRGVAALWGIALKLLHPVLHLSATSCATAAANDQPPVHVALARFDRDKPAAAG
jgi:hypothetical protein